MNLKSKVANFVHYRKEKIKQWKRENLDEKRSEKIYEEYSPKLGKVQEKIITDLTVDGISIIQFTDLFSKEEWEKLRSVAFEFKNSDEVKNYIQKFKDNKSTEGFATDFYAKKYIYRKYNIDRKNETIDYNDDFLKFGIQEKLLDIAGGYFGRYGKLRMIDLWYNISVGEAAPMLSQNWHRDGEDSQLIKVFLYFNDVYEETGPFIYVPKSHLQGEYGELWPGEVVKSHTYGGNYPDEKEFNKKFNPEYVKVCTGEAGTMIFCDTYGLHKGGYCKTKDRLLGNWVYTTPSSFCENVTRYIPPNDLSVLSEKQKFALSF